MLLALNGPELGRYRRTLAGVSTKRIRVALLDRTGNVVQPLTPAFRDGQLTVDTTRDVDRAVNLTILDPQHAFGFDADTYSGGILDLTRMVRVWWITDGPLLANRVTVPVFTGPVTRLERDGALVTIEAQGKEVRGLREPRRTMSFREGAQKTDVIRAILRELMGETRMDVPDLGARLPRHLVVSRKDKPWKVACKIAESMNRQLYYDGGGTARLRSRPGKPSWTFDGGVNGGELTSGVKTSADLQAVVNHVRVVGAKPKGKKTPIVGIATADRNHALSPWQLGDPETGDGGWFSKTVENNHIRTQKEADNLADDLLEDGLRLIGGIEFTAAPCPVLDPGDMIRVVTDEEALTARVKQYTLPLGLGGEMSFGSRKNLGLRPRRPHRGK